jgi:hypothetical protein
LIRFACQNLPLFIFYFNALNFIHKSTNLPRFSRKPAPQKPDAEFTKPSNYRVNKSNTFKYNFKNV